MTAIKTCTVHVVCDAPDSSRNSGLCIAVAEIATDVGHVTTVDVEIQLRDKGWSVSASRKEHLCPDHKRGRAGQ